ncbi:MAG: ABC transporter permease [Candidatus Rokubacteria bacterium]|nr:ABC transporter permease [Candidatus Rokubacteria bacterium]MBI3107946.1 ABC transporter permease [Candidatus Rokubacteria bacterium]
MLAGLRMLLLPVAFLLAWQAISGGLVPDLAQVLPPPSRVVAQGWRVLASGDLLTHIGHSLVRVLGGFAIAAGLAIPLGIAIGLWEWIEDAVDPVAEFLRPIPPIAWIPLGILWFGIGDAQNMFIIFLGAFFPILLNTVAGVRRVDRTLVWGALTLGGRRHQIVREIVLPSALPLILTGLRIGLGVGWMALVAAELVAARSGLGFMIQSARYAFVTERVILGMVVIGALGLVMDRVIRGVARRLTPWAMAR